MWATMGLILPRLAQARISCQEIWSEIAEFRVEVANDRSKKNEDRHECQDIQGDPESERAEQPDRLRVLFDQLLLGRLHELQVLRRRCGLEPAADQQYRRVGQYQKETYVEKIGVDDDLGTNRL